MAIPVKAIYVHVPFCARKCGYCGFYSVQGTAGERGLFTEKVKAEWSERKKEGIETGAIETVYFGGGTPGMLGPAGLERLGGVIREMEPGLNPVEWTVEMNPAIVTEKMLRALVGMGVNRLSFGAQSFHDEVLKRCGRLHTAEMTKDAFRQARAAGFKNLGLDLIVGLPCDSDERWQGTLEQALALEPEHLSVYALSLEPGTAFAQEVAEKKWVPLSDDESADRLAATEERLGRAGYGRYEISNYSRPGFECKYNVAVWRGADYLGLGPAAASRIGLRRWTGPADVRAYLERGTFERKVTELNEREDAVERTLFRLRLAEGLNLQTVAGPFPVLEPLLEMWKAKLRGFVANGIMEVRGNGAYSLTRRGCEVVDAVMAELTP